MLVRSFKTQHPETTEDDESLTGLVVVVFLESFLWARTMTFFLLGREKALARLLARPANMGCLGFAFAFLEKLVRVAGAAAREVGGFADASWSASVLLDP